LIRGKERKRKKRFFVLLGEKGEGESGFRREGKKKKGPERKRESPLH